ncbi:MAG TPA: MaoC family dehydratase N-terminal domain-containing protein [Mycobacteriales bacterium]|nr:MaoC family dehydratase N-terminal domain-containing protein [Mycobacteriales bacterium]
MSDTAAAPDDLIGRTGEPFEFVVELGKVREFAHATQTTNPEYLEGPSPVSEATFLAAAQHWQTEKSNPLYGIPMDFKNILHGEQEYVFHGEPPRAGTALTGLQRVENVFTKEGKRGGAMRFTVIVTEFRDSTGKLVAEARGTRIETGQTPPKAEA